MSDVQKRIRELVEARQVSTVDGGERQITLDAEIALVVGLESNSRQGPKQSRTTTTFSVRFEDRVLSYEVEITVHGSAYTDDSWRDDDFYEEDLTPTETDAVMRFDGQPIYRWYQGECSRVDPRVTPGLVQRALEAVGLSEAEPHPAPEALAWAQNLLLALGLPARPKALVALCEEVLLPAMNRSPPSKTTRLGAVFSLQSPRTKWLTEQLQSWYDGEAARASAAATEVEGGRTTDAALDSGGAAFAQIEGPARTKHEKLTSEVMNAERLLASGHPDQAAALLTSVEAALGVDWPG